MIVFKCENVTNEVHLTYLKATNNKARHGKLKCGKQDAAEVFRG